MSNSIDKWDRRFLGLAKHVAQWSKDPSTQVGAVIVERHTNVIVSLGYNGPPRHTKDDTEFERDEKLARTLHAEENAILFAHRDLRGTKIYVTHHPCSHCAALIIQSGIAEVHCPAPSEVYKTRWFMSLATAQSMFDEAGV